MRTWHLLRHLARHHEVTYLAFAGRMRSQADLDGMREVCMRLETVPREEPAKGTPRFYTDVLAHSLDPLPYAVGKYRSEPTAGVSVRCSRQVASIPSSAISCFPP